jgi:hypothetical protein
MHNFYITPEIDEQKVLDDAFRCSTERRGRPAECVIVHWHKYEDNDPCQLTAIPADGWVEMGQENATRYMDVFDKVLAIERNNSNKHRIFLPKAESKEQF